MPKANREYWQAKIKRNTERDKVHFERLKELGWSILIVWECETKDSTKLKDMLVEFLNSTPCRSLPRHA
jgi:DNA mismatch endonuclease (patch repair protein)